MKHPIGATAFRPFFLAAAVLAAGWVPLWILALRGLAAPPTLLGPVGWHRHEMIFGYTLAAIAGFLLTAVRNWTSRPTLHGAPLLALVGIWCAARAANLYSMFLPRYVAPLLDTVVPVVVALVIGRCILQARSRANYPFPVLLLGLAAADLADHLTVLGVLRIDPARAANAALGLTMILIAVVAGRVIPNFTRFLVKTAQPAMTKSVERFAVGSVIVWALVDALPIDHARSGAAAVAFVAAGANALRMGGWRTRATARHPILFILHVAYGWLVAGLVLRGIAAWVPRVPVSAGTHALTAGCIGALTLGMMSWVGLAHTGRPIATPRAMIPAFGLITVAALVRVLTPILAPAWYAKALDLSALLWSAAFVIYLAVYARILTGPGSDSEPVRIPIHRG